MSKGIKGDVKSYLHEVFGNKNRDWRDEDIILDRVTLTPSRVTWSNIVPGVVQEGINSTVRVESNAHNPNQAAPQIHTVKGSDIIGTVTLRQGVTKGLNKMLTLPLNDTVFSTVLGNEVKINLGKKVTDLKKDKMTIAVSVEGGGQSASATIRTTKKIYRGSFQCDVRLSGTVIIEDQDGVFQQEIGDILTTNPIHVVGELEYLWDQGQHVDMSD